MIEWLQNYSGTGVNSSVNTERAELQFLRKEMIKYNKSYKDETHAQTDDETDDDDEEVDKFEEELNQKKQLNAKKGQRASVSAEAYGNFNKKKDYVPREIQKNSEQLERITYTLEKSFLFNTLDTKEKNTVILAFEERKLQNGECVIKQGDQGDTLYLIEKGYYECFKQFVS
jgi:cAMP-dependent protein kinase regulator